MNSNIYVLIEHLKGEVADISYLMLAAARQICADTNGEVVALLLGKDSKKLADQLAADRVLYLDHPALAEFSPDAYLQVIANIIKDDPPRLMFFGHTTIGMDVISGLGVRLGIPVISQCQSVSNENGELKFVSQICGGKIMAEGKIPQPAALVSLVPGSYNLEDGISDKPPQIKEIDPPKIEGLRSKHVEYIEPDTTDVDISKENILVAVGRGLQNQDDLELVEELAQSLGGAVCASRPIVDQGWLQTTRLVGKSGKNVKPKLYLALGISGAPEHIQGIASSELLIAVNTDPNAPIFDFARYGIDADMMDILSALTEQLEAKKVG